MQVQVPHDLGREEARRRLEAGLPKLEQHIPGGGSLTSQFVSDSQLDLVINAMGQKVPVTILIEDDRLDADVTVPAFLKMMSGQIGDFVKVSAEKMLAKA